MYKTNIKIKKNKKIKLNINANQLPDIEGDPERIYQVITNLVSNALKFTDDGQIVFGYEIHIKENMIHFYVQDTGIGIPKSKQETIFQRFIQAESKTTKLYGGTGLGLAISLGLIQEFEGKIELDSKEGIGSTFSFHIPLITK